MSEWFAAGIPLPIILEAIDGCFEAHRKGGRRRTVSSLSYCRHAVRKLWDDRRDLHVGSDSAAIPEQDVAGGLEKLSVQLDNSASGTKERDIAALIVSSASRIRALKVSTLPQADEALLEIENDLMESIRKSLRAVAMAELNDEVRRQLQGVRFSDDTVRDRTAAATLLRQIRRRYALPRLTLLS